jgi:hypothetical protein
MIQNFVCHVRRNPEPGHPGHAGPAQVMKPPSGHCAELIQLAFGLAELIKRFGSKHREDEWAALVCPHQHCH